MRMLIDNHFILGLAKCLCPVRVYCRSQFSVETCMTYNYQWRTLAITHRENSYSCEREKKYSHPSRVKEQGLHAHKVVFFSFFASHKGRLSHQKNEKEVFFSSLFQLHSSTTARLMSWLIIVSYAPVPSIGGCAY